MTLDDLTTMLDYHYWARDRLLDPIARLSDDQYTRDLGSSFRSIRDTVTHVYAAEWAWLERWQGRSPAALLSPNQFADVAALRAAWQSLEQNVRTLIGGLGPDVDRVVEYKLLSGQPGSSPMWQMVQHVVNHASYHRGQITTMLRQIGADPPKSMDLIAYYRTAVQGR